MLNALAKKPLIGKKQYKIRTGSPRAKSMNSSAKNAGLIIAEWNSQAKTKSFKSPRVGDEVTEDYDKAFTRWP